MKRGEIWTVSGGSEYSGKPRPAVIIQSNRFASTASIAICPFTTDPTLAPFLRLLVLPNAANGLRTECYLMVDKITTLSKRKVGSRIGELLSPDMTRLDVAIASFFALSAPLSGGFFPAPTSGVRS